MSNGTDAQSSQVNIVLEVIGIMNASKGKAAPLPVIGKWGEDWFKGIRKV